MPAHDSVDALVADWRRADPTRDVASLGVVQRIRRVWLAVERATEEHFAARGLSGPTFAVLSVLMRQADRSGVRQGRLAKQLQLTPGTVSLRIDQLERAGLVQRVADPDDRRSSVIELTAAGRQRFSEVADDHLTIQEHVLAALSADEREHLTALLRRLLVSFESPRSPSAIETLGVDLLPVRTVLGMQRRLGVAGQPGLLVDRVTAGSAAEAAELRAGDLITAADGRTIRSRVDLIDALEAPGPTNLQVRRGDSEHMAHVPDPAATS